MDKMQGISLSEYERELDCGLAPYAMQHGESGGRLHGNEPHPYRTCYQRDRDRIIHSKAFRRLGYKTQVFINSAGDNYRTRLTHSLEVAQISRSVSASLRLNPDFAEALALSHDLGHTPFGHAGQEALNRLMREHGGFEHNRQSLRIVSFLETRYLDFAGLNLTRSTLKGMMKHGSVYESDGELRDLCLQRKDEAPALEAALVDQCDRIAYVHHDLEDGLDSRILTLDALAELPFWTETWKRIERESGERFRLARTPLKIRSVIRALMNECISDLLDVTAGNLQALVPRKLSDILQLDLAKYPVAFSGAMKERIAQLQRFLHERLYRYPKVMQMSRRGARIIETLFEEFLHYPELMPEHYQRRIEISGIHRVVSDYIAGMTDRYAYTEFSRLTGQSRMEAP